MNPEPDFTKFTDGLVPVIIQDHETREVLTLAYTNSEAYATTREKGQVYLWSRSRQELWFKGGTSGNTQKVVSMVLDCDKDALLYLVEPAGPACHVPGHNSCFFNAVEMSS